MSAFDNKCAGGYELPSDGGPCKKCGRTERQSCLYEPDHNVRLENALDELESLAERWRERYDNASSSDEIPTGHDCADDLEQRIEELRDV